MIQETSREAYHTKLPAITSQTGRVYDIIREYGPLTDAEIRGRYFDRYGADLPPGRISARRGALLNDNLICEYDKVRNAVTGVRNIRWSIIKKGGQLELF